MPINKLQPLGRTSAGITLPKDDLRAAGLLDEDGDPIENQHMEIRKTGEKTWEISAVDPDQYPTVG